MAVSDRFISVDDHVQESPGLWVERLSKAKWGDRIPHIEQQTDGTARWVVDGRDVPLAGLALAGAGMPDGASAPQHWEDVPKMFYDPTERLEALDADGVSCSVLYPTVAGVAGETFARLTDLELEIACVQAYNDWLVEEWAAASQRFIPQCIVPIYPPEVTVAEIKRAVAKGHKGVVYPAIPMHLRNVPHINDPLYDPIWATCQELDVPLCFHSGSSKKLQYPRDPNLSAKLADALEAVTRPASAVFDVVNVLFSRILLRYPKLKVVFAESSLGWGAFLLEYADHQFEQDNCKGYELKPSEMFKRQCYLTGWYDSIRLPSGCIDADNVMWSTCFPMANSSWPNSRELSSRCLAGISAAERRQILCGNAAKLYKL